MKLPGFVLLALSAGAQGQILIQASSASIPAPDSVTLLVTVTTPQASSIEDAIALVPGLGLSAANLVYVSSILSNPFNPVSAPAIAWEFSLNVPLAKIADRIALITAAAKSAMVSFNINASTSQAPPCAYAQLISDARAQAQKLANAAGVTLGPVSALADGPATASGSIYAAPTAAVRSPGFAGYLLGAPVPAPAIALVGSSVAVAPSTCSLTVQFMLQH